MSAIGRFEHQFVKSAPRALSPGVLYVSLEYCSMQHLCACGCGRKVVTPLSPNDWMMSFNGKNVSVEPSIGSWSLPCKSHYFIERGRVVWAGQWSDEKVRRGREADLIRKRGNAAEKNCDETMRQTAPAQETIQASLLKRIWHWLWR